MGLTKTEIAELKVLLQSRKSARVKKPSPQGVIKLLVGPHGRVVGRVLAFADDKPLDGHEFIKDDRAAKIGMKVFRGKVLKPGGKRERRNILDADDNVLNCIIVDPDDLPVLADDERFET